MKKLSTVMVIVLAVVAVGAFVNAGGARKALAASVADAATLSNKLATANVQVAEKEAAFNTLRVQQSLYSNDLAVASNAIAKLRVDLAGEQKRTAAALEATSRRDGNLQTLRSEFESARQHGVAMEQQVAALKAALSETRSAVQAMSNRTEQLSNQLNHSEYRRTELLQKWNDPAALRAQGKALDAATPPLAGDAKPSKQARLVLRPDGSVVAEE